MNSTSQPRESLNNYAVDDTADIVHAPVPQAEVCQLLSHLQRAVVLAHRGKNWTLLQNACRVLWNAITSLVNASGRVDGGERDEQGGQVVYGLACNPLYFAASGLTELLLHCRANPTLPEVRPCVPRRENWEMRWQ